MTPVAIGAFGLMAVCAFVFLKEAFAGTSKEDVAADNAATAKAAAPVKTTTRRKAAAKTAKIIDSAHSLPPDFL